MLRHRIRALLCIAVCLTTVYASALSPEVDHAWQWYDLQRRDLPDRPWWESHGGDFADARPADEGPDGLAKLFPEAIWYTGGVHLAGVEPISLAIRTCEGKQYTDLWLYVDTDADGRLDDETKLPATRLPDRRIEEDMVWWPTFEWPRVTAALDSEERADETLALDLIGYVRGPEFNTIVIMPRLREEWVASGSFAGASFEWHFLDYDGDGRIAFRSFEAGDRVLRRNPVSAGPESVFAADRPREVTTIGGQPAKLTIDWPNRRIGLRPYDEPTHTVHLSATDGRGRPMEIVRLTVAARGLAPIMWHRPPATIRAPVYQQRNPYYLVGGLGYHQLYIDYQLAYPDRPDATWEFQGPAEVFYGDAEEITLDLGGPLHIEADVSWHEMRGRLISRIGLKNARGDGLNVIGGPAEPRWEGWFIAPDGTVAPADIENAHIRPRTHWYAAITPGEEPQRGTWWVNAICDLGEYHERVRGSGRGEL
jgi:hypothetical protein